MPRFVFLLAAIGLTFAGYVRANLITNGTFGQAGNYNTTGWTTSGTVNATAAGAVLNSSGAFIEQDFVPGNPNSAAQGAIYDFQLDFTFSLSSVALNSSSPANRIRLEGNAGSDMISTRIASDGIFAFNGGTWASVLAQTINANTVYHVRVIGSDFDLATRSYTIGLSTDGVTYNTSSAVSFFHALVTNFDFEHVRFERGASAAVLTVDNVSAVPEPTALALAGLAFSVVGGVRRRRR